jgi:hypothetical protein
MLAAVLTAVLAMLAVPVLAEQHTITFNNQCGHGTARSPALPSCASTDTPLSSRS